MEIILAIVFFLSLSINVIAMITIFYRWNKKPQEVRDTSDNIVGKVMVTPKGDYEIIERHKPVYNDDEKLWMAERE